MRVDGVNDFNIPRSSGMDVAMGKVVTDVAQYSSEMILYNINFYTSVLAVNCVCVIRDNLYKTLLINTTINNGQVLYFLVGFLIIEENPVNTIQVLYYNIAFGIRPVFICDINNAKYGIMDHVITLYQYQHEKK